MKKTAFFSLSVLLVLVMTSFVVGQETPGAAPSKVAEQAAPQSPEYVKFNLQLRGYKENLKKLRSLKAEYQTAEPKRRDEIIAVYKPLINKTEELQKLLVPQAITAYEAVGGKAPELSQFLCAMLQWLTVGKEDYENAYRIASVLLRQELAPGLEVLYAYAAYAAFCVMKLDDAEKWFKIADSKNVVEKADPKDELRIRVMLERALPMYKKFWPKEEALRAKESSESLPRVRITTNRGDIVLELFKNEAPNAVGNFLTLVEKGFYNNTPFHRVLPFFMAQGGDPTGRGTGGPGYCIPCECREQNARMHFRGSISMAHAGPDTGGSQFFLTFVPTFFLNNQHTVFGRVVEGIEILSEIQRIDPEGENLPAPDKIVKATIERGKPFDFKKLPRR